MKINIKPLSVNRAWQGRRFKTPEYKKFANDVAIMLKPMNIPEGKLQIHFVFGFSSNLSDWDNPIKPFQDIMCGYYGIDDNRIYAAMIEKKVVPKGEEFIEFEIEEFDDE